MKISSCLIINTDWTCKALCFNRKNLTSFPQYLTHCFSPDLSLISSSQVWRLNTSLRDKRLLVQRSETMDKTHLHNFKCKRSSCSCFQHKKSYSSHFGDPALAFIKNTTQCQKDAGIYINNAHTVKYVYHWGEEKKKYLFPCATDPFVHIQFSKPSFK